MMRKLGHGDYREDDIGSPVRANMHKGADVSDLVAMGFAQNTRDEVRYVGGDGQIAGALSATPGMKQTTYVAQPATAFKVRGGKEGGGKGYLGQEEATFTLLASDDQKLFSDMRVRRLTPVECERLQGFPDSYTDIRPNDKDTPDGPRYKALGNSMAVPVMRFIGQQITRL